MTIKEFINENRRELTRTIMGQGIQRHTLDADEIGMWVLNDENLYNWAVDSGVNI